MTRVKDSDRKRKKHKRPNRSAASINTSKLKIVRAADSKEGECMKLFPTFRVSEASLIALNEYCDRSGTNRALLMRRLIHDFLEAEKSPPKYLYFGGLKAID